MQPQSAIQHLKTQKLDRWRRLGMLWTIFVILLVLWLIGWIGFHAIGWYIHLLLVVALVVLVIQLITGRRPVA
jgi:Flp pilus assembly protein TadB